MPDQPSHLATTNHLAEQLADHPDQALVAVIVEGFGNLESFIRNQPGDHPMIDTRRLGSIDQLPVTKSVVNALENAMPKYVVRSDAATALAGASIVAFFALEKRIQAIEERLANL